jgi:Fur family ferric uptake transcriptional regulator
MSSDHAHQDSPAADPREVLRRASLRVTAMRLTLISHLAASRHPSTAQKLFDDLCAAAKRSKAAEPDRVTVYRTLNTLVEAGLAHKVDPGDRVFRFSLTDHARCEGEHHHHEHPHFVCDDCGTVECLDGERVVIKGPGSTKRRVKQDGVVLHGTCGSCVKDPSPH